MQSEYLQENKYLFDGFDWKNGQLNDEQLAYLKEFADYQIGRYLRAGVTNETAAERYLKAAYEVAGLAAPAQLSWYDSPSSFAQASVRASVQASVWASVRASVGESVGASVGESVRASVGASVWAWWDADDASFYKAFNDLQARNNLESYCLFIEEVTGFYLEAERAHLIRKPIRLTRDDDGRLHNEKERAIEWPDGYGFYYLHGVEFDESTWRKIVDQTFTAEDLLTGGLGEDQRAVAVRMLKPELLLGHMNATLIHTGIKGTKLYRVDNFMGTGDTEYCMHMVDASTPREFIEWVDPQVGAQGNADLAQAAAWGIPLEDYLSIEQEA